MASQNQKVHGIIHLASASAAGVGFGLAQVPGSDSLALVPLQTAMIVAIAAVHGHSITKTVAADLLLTFSASMGGRLLSQWLVGWIPGYGNSFNAATAAAITQAIGWLADAYFAEAEQRAA